jgi:pSer/pThr/pTyr-binding forkhead associated (FHA) protein
MPDPRLNSCHLEFPRRLRYRHAREALLDARGPMTLDLELAGGEYDSERPKNYFLLGIQPEKSHSLKVGLNTIGKFESNDIVLEDISVSRRHCGILVHASGGCELHDTASTNGSFVNGLRVKGSIRLRTGDIIQIARCTFVLEGIDDPIPDAQDPNAQPTCETGPIRTNEQTT